MLDVLFFLALMFSGSLGMSAMHGIKLPLRLAQNIAPQNLQQLSSTADVTNSNDYSYLIEVDFSGQIFELALDTGSSDLWIISNCATSDCQGVIGYSAANSSTTVNPLSKPFKLNYLAGSVSGSLVTGTISLRQYEISSQTFGLVNFTSGMGLSGYNASGIIGFGFPGIASIPSSAGSTFLENVVSSLDAQNQFFAYKLGRANTTDAIMPAASSISSFTVGQLDSDLANDTTGFAFTNVSSAGSGGLTAYNYWKMPLQSIYVNGTSIPLSTSLVKDAPSGQPIAVLDTGTTLILGPTLDVSNFWATAGANAVRLNNQSGNWEVRCERALDVSFSLGESGQDKSYSVHPEDISWFGGNSTGDGWCLGGVQANDGVVSGDWILGDAFLRNVYVSHHWGNATHAPRIGLLNLTNSDIALQEFQSDRGDDSLPFTTPPAFNIPQSKPGAPTLICWAVVGVAGFLTGAMVVAGGFAKKREERSRRKSY